MSHHDITTPDELPSGATRVGPLVAWERDAFDGDYPICVWHWCDKSEWRASAAREGRTLVEDAMQPEWTPASASSHTLVSPDPLHLEPSVYWPGCCGLHGWIRDGQWVGA